MLQFNKKKVLFSVISFFFVVLLISIIFGKGVIEGRQPTLYSFSIINFAGYLFFLMLPVEILIPYYLSIGYSGVVLIILAFARPALRSVFKGNTRTSAVIIIDGSASMLYVDNGELLCNRALRKAEEIINFF
ncbi:MAG: hypothetical protein KKH40_03195, partial [Nanoarchaeota archaeon]|nr:hypothetical protein [Nanoarchaeota archaeon]